MRIFTNKNVVQKILIVMLVVLLTQLIIPISIVSAADTIGGKLFEPIRALVLVLGDSASSLLNYVVEGQSKTLLTVQVHTGRYYPVWQDPYTGSDLSNATNPAVDGSSLDQEIDFDNIELPLAHVTPDRIFSNQIALLDTNIFEPEKPQEGETTSAVYILQSTISSWYIVLRDIVIVGFLSVLVYVGIKIIISSTAQDKSKYKQMLYDWLIGLCLVFFMHYLMAGLQFGVEKLTDLVSSVNSNIYIEDDNIEIVAKTDDNEYTQYLGQYNEGELGTDSYNNQIAKLKWRTDLAGLVRYNASASEYLQDEGENDILISFGYLVMYVVLIIFTYMFVFQYLKRLINIIFLTLIAPVVAFAYPLDKMSDGQPQAFNMWFKEYLFNLLLQPMHLILYTVLLSSAIDLATTHPIYAIVVFAFMLKAEKLIRKMFGFEKASTMGAAATGAVTGAMLMHGINVLSNRSKHRKAMSSGKGGNGIDGNDGSSKIREQMANDISSEGDEDRLMSDALGEPNLIDGEQQVDDTRQGTQDSNINQLNIDPNEEFMDSIRQAQEYNDQYIEGGNIKDPSEEDPNYQYLHPEEYDEKGNYIGKSVNNKNNMSQDNIQIRQQNIADEDKLKEGKIDIKPIKKPSRFAAMVRYYGPSLAKGLAKGTIKATTAAITAGAVGTVALGAGLATDDDDYSTGIKYAALGIAGGAAMGNAIAGGAIKKVSGVKRTVNRVQQASKNITLEQYKNDPQALKRIQNQEANKVFMEDKNIKQKYASEFGEKEVSKYMNAALEYRKYGIKDNDIIISAMKQRKGEIGKTSIVDKRRIAAAKLATGVSNSKDIQSMTDRLRKMGYDDKKISANEEFVRSIKKLKYN